MQAEVGAGRGWCRPPPVQAGTGRLVRHLSASTVWRPGRIRSPPRGIEALMRHSAGSYPSSRRRPRPGPWAGSAVAAHTQRGLGRRHDRRGHARSEVRRLSAAAAASPESDDGAPAHEQATRPDRSPSVGDAKETPAPRSQHRPWGTPRPWRRPTPRRPLSSCRTSSCTPTLPRAPRGARPRSTHPGNPRMP